MSDTKSDLKVGLVIPAMGGPITVSAELAERLRAEGRREDLGMAPLIVACPAPRRLVGRVTYTTVELDLSPAAYDEIRQRLIEAQYHQAFTNFGQADESIDMSGIAITKQE